jgi:hypothetical protein
VGCSRFTIDPLHGLSGLGSETSFHDWDWVDWDCTAMRLRLGGSGSLRKVALPPNRNAEETTISIFSLVMHLFLLTL